MMYGVPVRASWAIEFYGFRLAVGHAAFCNMEPRTLSPELRTENPEPALSPVSDH